MCIAGIVGAGLPAIGCEAVVKSVSARRLTERGTRVDDWVAADCREASLYTRQLEESMRRSFALKQPDIVQAVVAFL